MERLDRLSCASNSLTIADHTDGPYESVASDYFDPVSTPSIHVYSRYVLWNMTDVEGASNLLHEMSIELGTPARLAHAGKPTTAPAARPQTNGDNSDSSLIWRSNWKRSRAPASSTGRCSTGRNQ
jgi:hypothetical protein